MNETDPSAPPVPRKNIQDAVDDRIARFSITALGYDPDRDEDPPRVLLEWVRGQKDKEERRHKTLGTIIIGAITAVVGASSWPVIQWVFKVTGH